MYAETLKLQRARKWYFRDEPALIEFWELGNIVGRAVIITFAMSHSLPINNGTNMGERLTYGAVFSMLSFKTSRHGCRCRLEQDTSFEKPRLGRAKAETQERGLWQLHFTKSIDDAPTRIKTRVIFTGSGTLCDSLKFPVTTNGCCGAPDTNFELCVLHLADLLYFKFSYDDRELFGCQPGVNGYNTVTRIKTFTAAVILKAEKCDTSKTMTTSLLRRRIRKANFECWDASHTVL